MSQDRRKAHRCRTLKEGRIVFNGAASVIDCTIRDLTDGGARLRVPSPCGMPGGMELLIVASGVRVAARLAWQHASELGIMFAQPGTQVRG